MNLKYTSIDQLSNNDIKKAIYILESAIDPDNVEELDDTILALAYAGLSVAIINKSMEQRGIDATGERDKLKWLCNDGSPFVDFLGNEVSQCLYHSQAMNIREAIRENKTSESDYGDAIEFNWSSIFPYLNLVKREFILDEGDRLDFFAMTKDKNRPVVIELKLGKKSAHKQLRSYATAFENPVLINISEELPTNQRDGIIYKTFQELGIDSNAVYATELGE